MADTNQLVETLSKMPGTAAEFAAKFSDKIAVKFSPDDFSITEHICHLRDLENEGYLVRIRKILAEDDPTLPDFEGGRIAKERDYNTQDAMDALRAFTAARAESIRVLSSLSEEQLEETGNLSGVGAVSIKELINLMLEHDHEHVYELQELVKNL